MNAEFSHSESKQKSHDSAYYKQITHTAKFLENDSQLNTQGINDSLWTSAWRVIFRKLSKYPAKFCFSIVLEL